MFKNTITKMIILRQKDYSLKMTRRLAILNRASGKSPMQAKRAAIRQQNKILTPLARGMGKMQKMKNALNSVAMNPGAAVNSKIIQPSIESPVTAVALKAVPVPGSSALVNVVGRPERKMWKKVGLGDKMHRVAERYGNTKTARYVEGGVNGALNSMKAMLS